MSFDDIVLSKTIIAELYKNDLVVISKPVTKINEMLPALQDDTLQYLGTNSKHIVVLVHYPDELYLPDEPLEFLARVLLACKLDVGQIAILNTAKQPATQNAIKILAPTSILIFGDCITTIPNTKGDYFKRLDTDDFSVITAPPLEHIYVNSDDGKQLKSKLWLSLRDFFKLSI